MCITARTVFTDVIPMAEVKIQEPQIIMGVISMGLASTLKAPETRFLRTIWRSKKKKALVTAL